MSKNYQNVQELPKSEKITKMNKNYQNEQKLPKWPKSTKMTKYYRNGPSIFQKYKFCIMAIKSSRFNIADNLWANILLVKLKFLLKNPFIAISLENVYHYILIVRQLQKQQKVNVTHSLLIFFSQKVFKNLIFWNNC